ncbi:hypothetical protein VitviT2T_018453 [Vitis vinifera]|uniref:Uncharacterized protein n=1 Tax=Vitis vinifera TaxID=29760 RepID=A0ABY9CZJ0_VITVI|nr:hypothetical protein VitviT2T_018453 [Vitis vinifera]
MAANLLKMGSWEPQENALRMKKNVECQPDRIPDARYPGKVERRLDRIPDVRYPEKVERWLERIPNVRYLGGMSTEKNSGCEVAG